MSTERRQLQTVVEPCRDCGRETNHRVTITLRTESRRSENSEFSREPYRVAECRSCGRSTSARMNNA